jgi:glycosyltransferase involved in cell wall biosynthesis
MNETVPKVSVVIPLYNQARFVADAIQSALSQTYRDLEIIVVDDGSTDNSREVAEGFGNHIRYIYQENQGLGGARNTGIRAARGEYIALLDADDCWMPAFLETMVALVEKHPNAAVFYCQAQCMDVNGRVTPPFLGGPAVPPGKMYHTLLRANFIIPSTVLARRSAIETAGWFDSGFRSCEDWDLWLRILRIEPKQDFIGSNACLVNYRLHASSLSSNLAQMQQSVRLVFEKIFGPDDGGLHSAPPEKRRAYGGVHRYNTLTFVQRQDNWQAASESLRQALMADPTLSNDLDLFYELAFGAQPLLYRGTVQQLNLEENARQIVTMLSAVFGQPGNPSLKFLRRETCGTANFALGLVSYNLGYRSLCRRFYLRALGFKPSLWLNSLLVGNFFKSFFSRSSLVRLKNIKTFLNNLS